MNPKYHNNNDNRLIINNNYDYMDNYWEFKTNGLSNHSRSQLDETLLLAIIVVNMLDGNNLSVYIGTISWLHKFLFLDG